MGGSALKNTTTRRLNRKDFFSVAAIVVAMLKAALPGARVEALPAYATKPDFGDLDVLVTSEHVYAAGGLEMLHALVKDKFFSTDQYANLPSYSFDYRESVDQVGPGFQVDVILQDTESYDFTLNYYSYIH